MTLSNKQQIDRKRAKTRVAEKIIDLLISEDCLSVSDGVEILGSCQGLLRERTERVMNEVLVKEGGRPLSEALEHLNRSGIKIVR